MKKKITAVLIAIAGIFGLAACKKDDPTISSVPSNETTIGPVESSSTEPSKSSSTEPSKSSSTEPSKSSSTEPSESSSTEPSESEDPSEVKHIVMFDTADGTLIESIEVVEGSKVEKPATDPTKVGHTFVNWYVDAEYSTVFNFEENIITAQTTIYAKWEINSYNVTFVVAGNENDLVIQVNYNSKITEEIANPIKVGHKFVGWFKEAAGTTAFDFTTEVIIEATSVYAKFESITFADFVEQGGVVYQNTFDEDQTVECVGTGETPTGNIYGTTSANDLEFDELNSVTIANGKFNVLDKSAKTTNGFILLEDLLEYEKIEIIAEVTPTANNSSWSLFNLIDENLAEIASMRTIAAGKMGYRVNGTAGTPSVTFTVNTAINVFISLDLVNGKITFVYNGTSLGEVDINASNLKGIKIITAGSASRDVLVDNLAVRAIASENSEIVTALKAKVQTHFDSLAVETNYITNLEEINTALAAGLTAIMTAEDKSAIIAAYNAAIVAINAVKSDATLALDAIKETAVADLKAYKNADQYITNAVQLTDTIAAGELAINAAKSEEAVAEALNAAKTAIDDIKDDVAQLAIDIPLAIAELEAYKNAEDYTMSIEELDAAIQNGKDAINVATISSEVWEALETAKTAIDQIDTDIQLIENKRLLACEKLSNYADEKIATIEDTETHADVISQISATVISGSETINSGNSYEEIEAALAEAKAIIDTLVASTQKTLDDVKNESKIELENYANEIISLYDAIADSELISAINQKATEGYAAINEQTTNTAAIEKVTEYKGAIDALVDADTLAKARTTAINEVESIYNSEINKTNNILALADMEELKNSTISSIQTSTDIESYGELVSDFTTSLAEKLAVALETVIISVDPETYVTSWDAIEGATGYLVYVNGVARDQQTEKNFTLAATESGDYKIEVVAVAMDYYASNKSNSIVINAVVVGSLQPSASLNLKSISTPSDSGTVLTNNFKTAETITINGVKFNIGASSSNMKSEANGLKFQKIDTSLSFTTVDVSDITIRVYVSDKARFMSIKGPEELLISGLTKEVASVTTEKYEVTYVGSSVAEVKIKNATAGTYSIQSEGNYTVYAQSVDIVAVGSVTYTIVNEEGN